MILIPAHGRPLPGCALGSLPVSERRWLAGLVGAIACLLAVACVAPGRARAGVEPYGYDNVGSFRNILPPGANGLDNPVQLAQFESTGTRPAHSSDQLSMYEDLPFAAPITQSQIPDYYIDATFGVKPGQVAKTETPEAGVTIEWDSAYGIPHIYGDTRAELEFGIGWANAEDRLFFMDALRHIGRAELTAFAGGGASDESFDQSQWAAAPYTEQDLQNQFTNLARLGPAGVQAQADIENYCAGVNAYIAAARINPTMMPGEYAALGEPLGPSDFVPADVVAIASLIGSQFGNGDGGQQLQEAVLLHSFERRFGRRRGYADWQDFAGTNDPEAPTTIRGHSFPYGLMPRHVAKGSIALPDPGSVQMFNDQTLSGVSVGASARPRPSNPLVAQALADLGSAFSHHQMSNALLISARDSSSGHPIAVMGPQVGYFSPEILLDEDIHGPGIDAEGAAFPGVGMYVDLGHGDDYAWSATSADQDITQTYAIPLCNPSGGAVAPGSDYYEYRGQCLAMQELIRVNHFTPNVTNTAPAGTETLTAYRTELGLLIARARIHGRPVIYVQDRSTYDHELDSAVGLEEFNDPSVVHSPQSFEHAAAGVQYAFNWFYVDAHHIATFNSGLEPVHAAGVDPLLPTTDSFTWKDFDPADNTSADEPFAAHARTVDQAYLTSWNDKSAPGDSIFGTPIYRSMMLDQGIQADLRGARKMDLAQLINVMANAATIDLRGDLILPLLLRVVHSGRVPAALRTPVTELTEWMRSGAHRRSPSPGQPYEDSEAIKLMDAWWPKLVKAIYGPAMGAPLYAEFTNTYGIDNVPNGGDGIGDVAEGTSPGQHVGSSWDGFFYGYVQKTLRQVLHLHVRAPYHRVWCGGGSLGRCRAALDSTLSEAVAEPLDSVYPADGTCPAGDQVCWDEISFSAAGAITQPLIPWQNRPTFQQVVEIDSGS
jgi:acyl-homoserine lactone acylase PvdQ